MLPFRGCSRLPTTATTTATPATTTSATTATATHVRDVDFRDIDFRRVEVRNYVRNVVRDVEVRDAEVRQVDDVGNVYVGDVDVAWHVGQVVVGIDIAPQPAEGGDLDAVAGRHLAVPMHLGNAAGLRQTKDYNVKGSAWIAKEDGRMVRFRFDNIYTFADGTLDGTHFEGTVTRN